MNSRRFFFRETFEGAFWAECYYLRIKTWGRLTTAHGKCLGRGGCRAEIVCFVQLEREQIIHFARARGVWNEARRDFRPPWRCVLHTKVAARMKKEEEKKSQFMNLRQESVEMLGGIVRHFQLFRNCICLNVLSLREHSSFHRRRKMPRDSNKRRSERLLCKHGIRLTRYSRCRRATDERIRRVSTVNNSGTRVATCSQSREDCTTMSEQCAKLFFGKVRTKDEGDMEDEEEQTERSEHISLTFCISKQT